MGRTQGGEFSLRERTWRSCCLLRSEVFRFAPARPHIVTVWYWGRWLDQFRISPLRFPLLVRHEEAGLDRFLFDSALRTRRARYPVDESTEILNLIGAVRDHRGQSELDLSSLFRTLLDDLGH